MTTAKASGTNDRHGLLDASVAVISASAMHSASPAAGLPICTRNCLIALQEIENTKSFVDAAKIESSYAPLLSWSSKQIVLQLWIFMERAKFLR